MHTTKFRFIWPSGFRGEDLKIGQSETPMEGSVLSFLKAE
jgi:hypothetical protein